MRQNALQTSVSRNERAKFPGRPPSAVFGPPNSPADLCGGIWSAKSARRPPSAGFGAPNFLVDLQQPDLERQIFSLFVQIPRSMRQIPSQTSACRFGAPRSPCRPLSAGSGAPDFLAIRPNPAKHAPNPTVDLCLQIWRSKSPAHCDKSGKSAPNPGRLFGSADEWHYAGQGGPAGSRPSRTSLSSSRTPARAPSCPPATAHRR